MNKEIAKAISNRVILRSQEVVSDYENPWQIFKYESEDRCLIKQAKSLLLGFQQLTSYSSSVHLVPLSSQK